MKLLKLQDTSLVHTGSDVGHFRNANVIECDAG
jgi:hypothetical protein